jgi:hypothetical protein
MTSVPTGSRSDRLGFALQHWLPTTRSGVHNEDVDPRRDGRQPSQHRIRDPPSARPVDGGQQNVQRPNTLATTRRHRPLCATGSIREVDPRTIGSRTISARPGPCRYSSSPIHDIASGSSRRASLTESPAKERHCFGHLSGEAHSIARTAPPVRAPNRAASTLDAAPESTVRGSHVCPARPGPIGESQTPCPAAARASPGIPPHRKHPTPSPVLPKPTRRCFLSGTAALLRERATTPPYSGPRARPSSSAQPIRALPVSTDGLCSVNHAAPLR